jgi:hypothetical protein
MSVTQRQGVITCIPKEGKSKEFLKNWRPITLLNSTYKLASSCIAEMIKSVLSHLISTDQTGFIPGRYIGENCRLIYDILHFTEENDIPGILKTNFPASIQKNLKKSAVKPSDPVLLLFFMRFNADVNSGKLISPSNDCF